MKKIIAVASLVCITFLSYSQIEGGVKFGVNIANQKIDVEGFNFSPDSKLAFHVGGYLNLPFGGSFSVQPELLFNSVGFKVESGGDTYKETWNYVAVPVMLRYNINDMINLHVGPQFSFLMNAKGEFDGNSEDIEDTQSLEVAAGFGLGINLPMGLNLSARYVLGLSNVYDLDNNDGKITNNVFQISAGYRLFGKK
ncbi:MAG: PorT family protein [Cyclobacteriaceae bacterium]|nr:PorT family protein [Cyclobacteriaceae bacterium]UYN85192.1 MAG: PorT family protein [Cyclobacteriaceae bacterium]